MIPTLVEILFKEAKSRCCTNSNRLELCERDLVVVNSEGALEIGAVLRLNAPLSERKAAHGDMVRKATDEDAARFQANRRRETEAFRACLDLAARHELTMKLVDVESKFDGSKLTFFFTAEKRVDFRALVRDLASMFRGRIEMHQIGVRDEARRRGGFGLCGRELCCVRWIRTFEPVTLKMAKEQNLSMTSNKMLGLCSRLMCCLNYENRCYEEAAGDMPKVGSVVSTPQGEGTVYKLDIFRQRVSVKFEEGYAEFELSQLRET
ncbi:MAG: regulatory iron-sulfur-containing complex subunit RicT [Candidatus Edwardsbacteria bacterium]|nr:regulatory iron-sulfur-containing complex subunit RicT [Candidatus Edwardsbacteria bacterium]